MSATKPQWVLAAASLATLCAQAPDVPTIRVTTRLVEINAIVRDHKGPVEGLTKDDFTVLDNGKPQKIALFAMNSTRVLTKAPAPLPPNVFTNIPAKPPPPLRSSFWIPCIPRSSISLTPGSSSSNSCGRFGPRTASRSTPWDGG
jgi:hypothetical protein